MGMQKPVRGGLKRPSPNTSFLNTTNNASDDASEDDAKAENASLVEELKSRLVKAETASEEYQRQLNMLQANLNDSLVEHGKLEDQLHDQVARIEEFETERLQVTRQKLEMEDLFESERMAMVQDKAEQKGKEEEQQVVIKRLKETLAQREIRVSGEEDKGLPRSRKLRYASNPKRMILIHYSELPESIVSRYREWPLCTTLVPPAERFEK